MKHYFLGGGGANTFLPELFDSFFANFCSVFTKKPWRDSNPDLLDDMTTASCGQSDIDDCFD
jgi:hypothetical protein